MAKNIVKVNEEEIRGYMVGNIPDAIEKEEIGRASCRERV